MDNQQLINNPLTATGGSPLLTRSEINALFVSNLSDVYNMKTHLASIIPAMVKRASYQSLKRAILNTGLELDAQLLRIDFVFKYLKYDNGLYPQPLMGNLDFKQYLFANLEGAGAYQSDYILLNHLIMIEHIEIAQFKTLLTLAKGVYHKKIYTMIKLCLDDAVKEKRTFELLTQVYKV